MNDLLELRTTGPLDRDADRDGAVIDLRDGAPVLDPTDRRAPAATPDRVHLVAIETPADPHELDVLAARWLGDRERAVAAGKGERARRGHVVGRIAAKQAIRAYLAALDVAPPAAGRIDIDNDEHGAPVIRIRGARVATRHLRISIAHSARAAAAVAGSPRPSSGRDGGLGIDAEPIEPRSDRFDRLILTPAERDLAPVPDDDRDAWLTRLWAAKEAAAKATGLGLQGRPKAFEVAEVDGSHLRVGHRWIATERFTLAAVDHVVAWTTDERTECAWHRS